MLPDVIFCEARVRPLHEVYAVVDMVVVVRQRTASATNRRHVFDIGPLAVLVDKRIVSASCTRKFRKLRIASLIGRTCNLSDFTKLTEMVSIQTFFSAGSS